MRVKPADVPALVRVMLQLKWTCRVAAASAASAAAIALRPEKMSSEFAFVRVQVRSAVV